MWSILVHLTRNMWRPPKKAWEEGFDEETWEKIVTACGEYKINAIVLDIGDGMEYKSHPEISLPGCWSQERMKKEIARCREMGITIIPKLNFSTNHDTWMGEYHQMISTNTYYQVCKDLILEVAEVFEKPEYIHLGMDEESLEFTYKDALVIIRQGETIMKDMKFLCNCVAETGAKPWIWHSCLFEYPELFKKYFTPDEVVISPYHYNAFKEEHFTPIDSFPETAAYYSEGKFADMNITYVEEDPFFARFHEQALPNARYGYKYVPCASVYNKCVYNHDDLVEHFRDNAPENCVIGYMTAPWFFPVPDQLDKYIDSVKQLDAARRKFYPEEV